MPDRPACMVTRAADCEPQEAARTTVLRVLAAGAVHRVEFQPIVRWLQSCAATTIAARLADVSHAELHRADLAVWFQARAGEVDERALAGVRAAAPLLRVVVVAGPWCEGERRRGAPPGGVWRIAWHQCRARLERALADAARGACPDWGQPLTAGSDEWYRVESQRPWPGGSGTVLIAAGREMAPLLVDACQAVGYGAVAIRAASPCYAALRLGPCRAAIWEGSDATPRELAELSSLVRAVHPAPVVALLDFPRGESLAAAYDRGAAAVLGKPVALGDLFDVLGRWDGAARGRSPSVDPFPSAPQREPMP